MKKTIIVLMLVLLSAVLMISCNNNTNTPDSTPSKTYEVGETIELGTKEGNTVAWLILEIDTEDNTALLISKDILESRQFDSSTDKYQNSAIKKYLNQPEQVETFFTNYGLKTDYMVNVDVTSNIEKTEKNTGSDYVFLLSATEYGKYKATITTAGNSKDWWLRTPSTASSDTHTAKTVVTNGSTSGDTVSYKLGIRPAFWYKLK